MKKFLYKSFKGLFLLTFMLSVFVAYQYDAKAASTDVGKPVNLRQANGTEDWVEVTWDELHNADDWECQISNDGKTWRDGPSYCWRGMHLSDLEAGTSIWFKVRGVAKNDYGTEVGYGVWSDPIELVTYPDVHPTNVKGSSITSTGFTVTWKAVTGANIYKVEVDDKTYYPTSTKLVLKNLKKNSDYEVKVYAGRQNKAGTYTGYQIWCFSESSATVPLKPTKPTKVVFGMIGSIGKPSITVKAPSYSDHYSSYNRVTCELWTAFGKSKKVKSYSDKTYIGYIYGLEHKYLKSNANTMCKIRVRYEASGSDSKYVAGDWSKWYYICNRVNYNSAKRLGNKVTISWKKVKGTYTYKVYASNTYTGGYKLLKTTKSNKLTVSKVKGKKLKSGSTYYFKVVPYVKAGGKLVKPHFDEYIQSVYLTK